MSNEEILEEEWNNDCSYGYPFCQCALYYDDDQEDDDPKYRTASALKEHLEKTNSKIGWGIHQSMVNREEVLQMPTIEERLLEQIRLRQVK